MLKFCEDNKPKKRINGPSVEKSFRARRSIPLNSISSTIFYAALGERGARAGVARTAQRGAGCHGKIATSEPEPAQKGPSTILLSSVVTSTVLCYKQSIKKYDSSFSEKQPLYLREYCFLSCFQTRDLVLLI